MQADAIGPRQVCRSTCNGCPALKTEDWTEYPDGERDSGTMGTCLAAGKSISAYWHESDAVPAWCPALASPAPSAPAEPAQRAGWRWVPAEPTKEMISAYLKANDAYWHRTDEIPTKLGKWRSGTPDEATAEGYRAMLAAAPAPEGVPQNTEGVKGKDGGQQG